jgi:hypothetical protein
MSTRQWPIPWVNQRNPWHVAYSRLREAIAELEALAGDATEDKELDKGLTVMKVGAKLVKKSVRKRQAAKGLRLVEPLKTARTRDSIRVAANRSPNGRTA